MKHFNLLTVKRFGLLLCFLSLSLVGFAQTAKVEGVVTSADDKQPLIGVSISIKGTTHGVVTDVDGSYSLQASKDAVLIFSYIGFDDVETAVGSRTRIDVAMSMKVDALDDIIVMGYSSQSKAELSSSVVTLEAADLHDVTSSDIGNLLQGKVSGVMVSNSSGQPGSAAEIRIRGAGSITAQADPLYVVDGIPGGSFNPNDVETLTVMKDAGATALYGSAAAGGVIVVTTKQAERGKAASVNFKASYGIKEALQGNFQMMSGSELYDMQSNMYSEILFAIQRPAELADTNFDWFDAIFDVGTVQNYYVSVSGSEGNTSYYASADYYDDQGTVLGTSSDRISTRLNLNTKLASKLDMNVRLNYSQTETDSEFSYLLLQGAYGNMPWDIPYDDEGNLIYVDSSTRPDNGETWYGNEKSNVLHSAQYNYITSISDQLDADMQLIWSINDWLSLTSSNRYSKGEYKYTQYIDPRSYDATYANGYISESIGIYDSWSTSNLLKASQSKGLHSYGGMLGWEYGKSMSTYTSASGTGMPDGIDALSATSPLSSSGYTYEGASYSIFGQAQYSYANKYFVTGSLRADASYIFGKDNRVGYFPSVSGSWLISEEEFMSDVDAVSFLKFRASYGVTGNSNIDAYQSLSTYTLDLLYQDNVGASAERLSNPTLTWESAHMTNIGVDVSFMDRFHFTVDLYNIENKDLLLSVPQSPSTGFFERTENSGSVQNRGIEFQITTDNIRTKDFSWTTSFNIGLNRNEVKDLADDESFLQTDGSSLYQQVKSGQDIYSWYMYKWLGVDSENGDPLWEKLIYDDDGNVTGREATNDITEADLQVVGKATPVFSGGLTSSMYYKGVGLHITANFVYGNEVYNSFREMYDSDGAYPTYNQMVLQDGWSRWEEAGDDATHPKLALNGNQNSNSTSSRYLEDGSFLRIRNISLTYDLPEKLLSKSFIKSCRFSLSGDNLFTFTSFSGVDPEVSLESTSWSLAGQYQYSYPISRQFLLGVDVKF